LAALRRSSAISSFLGTFTAACKEPMGASVRLAGAVGWMVCYRLSVGVQASPPAGWHVRCHRGRLERENSCRWKLRKLAHSMHMYGAASRHGSTVTPTCLLHGLLATAADSASAAAVRTASIAGQVAPLLRMHPSRCLALCTHADNACSVRHHPACPRTTQSMDSLPLKDTQHSGPALAYNSALQ
jgi:hypothetical protein